MFLPTLEELSYALYKWSLYQNRMSRKNYIRNNLLF